MEILLLSPLECLKHVVKGILFIQFIVVLLNYTRDWRNVKKKSSTNLNAKGIETNTNRMELNSNTNKNETNSGISSQDSLNNENSKHFGINNTLVWIKKLPIYISVLPLSMFYLMLKLSYHIMRVVVYNSIDMILYSLDYYLYHFPERFEDDLVPLVNKYIFQPLAYIFHHFIAPFYLSIYHTLTNFLQRTFTKENIQKVAQWAMAHSEKLYYHYLKPAYTKSKLFFSQVKNALVSGLMFVFVHASRLGRLLLHTLVLFSKDLFEDVQLAWTGVKWFGINIGKPAASLAEEIFLSVFIRPTAYTALFMYVLVKDVLKLVGKSMLALLVLLPTLGSMIFYFIYEKLQMKSVVHLLHQGLCRFILLPLWYIVDFFVRQGENLVCVYLPKVWGTVQRGLTHVYQKLHVVTTKALTLLARKWQEGITGLRRLSQNTLHFLSLVHQSSARMSKQFYDWIRHYVFPVVSVVYTHTWVLFKTVFRETITFLSQYCLSAESFVGKSLRQACRLILSSTQKLWALGQVAWLDLKNGAEKTVNWLLPYTRQLVQWGLTWINTTLIHQILLPFLYAQGRLLSELTQNLYQVLVTLVQRGQAYLTEGLMASYQYLTQVNKDLTVSLQSKKQFNEEYLKKEN